MQTRRQFLRNSAMLSAAGLIPASIQRAFAIEPEKGSSYLDAEHVVILMQENRSFDHAFGTLKGVRGFNDPRAIRLPDGNPVWVQANSRGERYVPFRLDIKETKSTWMGGLPHGWADQVDAANGGKHDRWLDVKKSGNPFYAKMPLTLGYYSRADIPFYYALADAFTICDQYFCSSLTGTTPNRLHLWTGTIRARQRNDSPALVRNEDCDYGRWVNWKTFPERLEDHGVSWKIYQNELSVPTGLSGEADAWLANFTDNPIEWFTQFNVRFARHHQNFLAAKVQSLSREIDGLKKQLPAAGGESLADLKARIAKRTRDLESLKKDIAQFSAANFAKLSPREKNLHARAFATNSADPAYRELMDFTYKDGDSRRTLKLPKGDVLHQFRQDVATGNLPTVSWLVAPEKFSDHPSAPWYGAWYVSEVLDILTKNPNVWQKTVFMLTYDENDGYFDHIPPFQAPHPRRPESGLASKSIDTSLEQVDLEQDRQHKPNGTARGNSIGLGFRVPMIIASPWTRGGCVCSQVFDHTSVLQFLEKWLAHKTEKKIEETNISNWRRTICGDLTSAFQSARDREIGLKDFLKRDATVAAIHKARFKSVPSGFRVLTDSQAERIRTNANDPLLPRQETGLRRSAPLPYQLQVDGALNKARDRFAIRFEARKDRFGERAKGAPFIAYAVTAKGLTVRHYAVAAGEHVEDSWPLSAFENRRYHLRVHGPNGFFREFRGGADDPLVTLEFDEVGNRNGGLALRIRNRDTQRWTIAIRDGSYSNKAFKNELSPGEQSSLTDDCSRTHGWYDLIVKIEGVQDFQKRYAGRVENGEWSYSDPAMGRAS